jgi:hypothetical protein
MHEWHTLYRREQSADWNYLPSQPYALPVGPVVAVSDPSPSYYAKTNAKQINAQQKAYAEALLEENRMMKERIDALQKNESAIQSLQRRSGAAEEGAGLPKGIPARPGQQRKPRFFALARSA